MNRQLHDITLRRLRRDDFALLAFWLAQPHVARWWNHETSPQAIERDFGAAIDGSDPAEVFIAVALDRPFGLIQRYTFGDNPSYMTELSTLLAVPPEALSIDYFVGPSNALRVGLGTAMLQAAVRSTWDSYPHAPAVIVPVASNNIASKRVLEKAGFRSVVYGLLEPDNPIDDRDHDVYRIERP